MPHSLSVDHIMFFAVSDFAAAVAIVVASADVALSAGTVVDLFVAVLFLLLLVFDAKYLRPSNKIKRLYE